VTRVLEREDAADTGSDMKGAAGAFSLDARVEGLSVVVIVDDGDVRRSMPLGTLMGVNIELPLSMPAISVEPSEEEELRCTIVERARCRALGTSLTSSLTTDAVEAAASERTFDTDATL
jgi:hypothetical protein